MRNAAAFSQAVSATAWLRLLLAFTFGLLLSLAWDASVASVPGGWARWRQRNALIRAWKEVKLRGGRQHWRSLGQELQSWTLSESAVLMAHPRAAATLEMINTVPPVLLLAGVDVIIITAAFLAIRVAPKLLLREEMPPQLSLIMRVLSSILPGAHARFQYVAAFQRLSVSLFDDTGAFLIALCLYQLVPLL